MRSSVVARGVHWARNEDVVVVRATVVVAGVTAPTSTYHAPQHVSHAPLSANLPHQKESLSHEDEVKTALQQIIKQVRGLPPGGDDTHIQMSRQR